MTHATNGAQRRGSPAHGVGGTNARAVALQVVRDVFPGDARNERGAQESLDYRASKANLDVRDRAFATELAYGAIKMRRTLDWYLQPFVGTRTKELPPATLDVLRLAVYELVYTRADEHATVFEFVNLARTHGHRGLANLANAVLRSFLRDRPQPPQREQFESEDEFLGVAHSLPTWLVRNLRAAFPDRVAEICAAVNAPAQAAIVVNALRAKIDGVERVLTAGGARVRRSPFVGEALLLEGAASLRKRESEAAGVWWVQSESAAMPVAILNPQPGEAVLDVASGRGNKALQSGARMAEGEHFDGTLLCVERDARKAAMLERRLAEAGIAAGIVIGDAREALLSPEQRFDRVLLDAPCSGIGVIGRHPEARWRKGPGDGERLAAVQLAMLERQVAHLHQGGSMVYAVCSTDARETTEVVEALLRTHDVTRGAVPAQFEPFLTPAGDVLVPPGIEGRDGFYVARLEKRL